MKQGDLIKGRIKAGDRRDGKSVVLVFANGQEVWEYMIFELDDSGPGPHTLGIGTKKSARAGVFLRLDQTAVAALQGWLEAHFGRTEY